FPALRHPSDRFRRYLVNACTGKLRGNNVPRFSVLYRELNVPLVLPRARKRVANSNSLPGKERSSASFVAPIVRFFDTLPVKNIRAVILNEELIGLYGDVGQGPQHLSKRGFARTRQPADNNQVKHNTS